ncbi:MAG: 5-(carboxyamino)imidazole ribonucleotide mutase [Cytophagales bacterium]|nr:5-(carboxyamino)imidazole ribonucleotide mutase [Cytophagales bacterium]
MLKNVGKEAKVGIIMGSSSDLSIMKEAAEVLDKLDVSYELTIVSAHRTPHRMFEYAENAEKRGLNVIIAGAGGAAHLPGMVAAISNLPVIGVPIKSQNSLEGWDSILSILQMPGGVPVATVALNSAKNAGILAAQIIATHDKQTADALKIFRRGLRETVEKSIKEIEEKFA